MNDQNKKDFRIEAYIPRNKIVDATELRRKLNLTTDQMQEAISEAHDRGHHLFCIDGKMFRAIDSADLEIKLLQVRDMHDKTSTIEHEVKKDFKTRQK